MGRRRQYTQDIGDTGLDQTWGQINEDFLNEWNGNRKIRRINEMMRNSPLVGAVQLAIEMSIMGADYYIEGEGWSASVGDNVGENATAQLVLDSLNNLTTSFHQHLSEATDAVFYGWTQHTLTYEQVNGQLWLRKLRQLKNDTIQQWLFGDDGGLMGIKQWGHLWAEPIPIDRLVVYTHRKRYGNPEGMSILRPAWLSYYYAKNLTQIEAISEERLFAGLPVITAPMTADMTDGGSDASTANAIVRNVRNDEQAGIVLPNPDWKFELMASTGGNNVSVIGNTIDRHEKRMLTAMLSQFLLIGQSSVGTQALVQGQTDFFTLAANTLANNICDTFSKYVLKRLLALNGIDEEVTLRHTPVGDIDLNMIGTFLTQVGDKLTFTANDEAWLRGIAQMPQMDIDEIERVRDETQQEMESELRDEFGSELLPLFGFSKGK